MLRDHILTTVQLIGVVQCLFIAFALLYLPGHRGQASRWLAGLLLVWALMFAQMALQQNDLEYLVPLLAFFRLPLFFLSGPLLYLYLRQVTAPAEPMPWRYAAGHMAIGAVFLIAYAPSLGLDRNALLHTMYYRELRELFPYTAGITSTQEWLLAVTSVLLRAFVLHLFVYLVLCLRLLARHRRMVREHYSRLDQVSLDWLRNLLFALAALWLSIAASQVLFAGTGIARLINDLQKPALVLFFSALGIYGLLQKSIPLPGAAEAPAATNEPALQAEAARLLAWMRTEKPHLDNELTLVGLAAQLRLPPRQLSQVINAGLGQNFLDFVNGYRVEEAKGMLADQGCSRSILTIAMDAGFNSKSAFYSAFKRHTGQTPSQFRNDCLAARPAPQA